MKQTKVATNGICKEKKLKIHFPYYNFDKNNIQLTIDHLNCEMFNTICRLSCNYYP